MCGPRLLLLIGALGAGAATLGPACKGRERTDETPTAIPSGPMPLPTASAPAAEAECKGDEDCMPLNCCYALQPSACVTRARARCDGFTIDCEPYNGPRFSCACVQGQCFGNPGAASQPDAGRPKQAATWAMGDLKDTT